MRSERLTYTPLGPEHLAAFHRLVQDAHIRRYLLDGNLFDETWSAARIEESRALFRARGVGLWLVTSLTDDDVIGFCGFLEMPPIEGPQLVYAMFERHAGKGYAKEMARASIRWARAQPGFEVISAGVDEINVASLHVLETLGFERVTVEQGSFGNMPTLHLTGECR